LKISIAIFASPARKWSEAIMSNGKAEIFALGLEFPPCLFGRGNVDEQPITHQA